MNAALTKSPASVTNCAVRLKFLITVPFTTSPSVRERDYCCEVASGGPCRRTIVVIISALRLIQKNTACLLAIRPRAREGRQSGRCQSNSGRRPGCLSDARMAKWIAPEPTFITTAKPAQHLTHDYCSFFGPMWCGTSVLGPPPQWWLPPDAGFEPVLFFPIWRGTSVRST